MQRHFRWLVVAAAAVACGDDEGWQRSRAEYCAELERTKARAMDGLDGASRHLDAARLKEAEAIEKEEYSLELSASDRNYLCAAAHAELVNAGSYAAGFDMSTHVLARGRPDGVSVEEAGFQLSTPSEAITSMDQDVHLQCRDARFDEARRTLETIRADLLGRYATQIDACQQTMPKE